MMTSYSFFGSGDVHCSSQPLWPRMASRAMANTEYFFTLSLAPKIADMVRASPVTRGVSLAKPRCLPYADCDGACRFAPESKRSACSGLRGSVRRHFCRMMLEDDDG